MDIQTVVDKCMSNSCLSSFRPVYLYAVKFLVHWKSGGPMKLELSSFSCSSDLTMLDLANSCHNVIHQLKLLLYYSFDRKPDIIMHQTRHVEVLCNVHEFEFTLVRLAVMLDV